MAEILSDEEVRELSLTQHRIYEKGIPLLIIFEGNSGAVNGRVISDFMNVLEPRGVRYRHFDPKYHDDAYTRFQLLYRGPARGSIAIYDRSWYAREAEMCRSGRSEPHSSARRINRVERYLVDNGVRIIKVFLRSEDLTSVRKEFDRAGKKKQSFLDNDDIEPDGPYGAAMDEIVSMTDTDHAHWVSFKAEDAEETASLVIRNVKAAMDAVIDYRHTCRCAQDVPSYPNPRKQADLTLKAEGYKKRLAELQEDVARLQRKLAASDRSMALVFEGWDAAGKGGSIKRLVHGLNPRGYKVVSAGKPTEEEYSHTYLWRFFHSLPRTGKITIYDRSWYGRMMVEPIEGFCTEEEYARSASEINVFESGIRSTGCMVLKFWLEISNEEQLRRFNARVEDPLKNWKITDEDWRNREKWDVYERYVDLMMERTNTPESPWIVIEAEDKKHARIRVLEEVVRALEKAV